MRVAAWANARSGTKPVTWFPAALIEWDTPIEGRPGPAATEAPAAQPWWRQIFQLTKPSRLIGLFGRSLMTWADLDASSLLGAVPQVTQCSALTNPLAQLRAWSARP